MIGRVIYNYRIEEFIGEGGMGTVYRAVDTVLGRDIALKMLHPSLIKQSTFFERFKNEAQILARLNHPNIAILHNFIEDNGDHFMVMEYIEGIDLEKKLKSTGAFTTTETISLMKQALSGLAHAHKRGVFHRDLKPSNLILTPDGQVKIMDFGIAKAVGGEKLTQVNRLVGTLEYIAPEILKGEEPSSKSDLYAMGVVFYELLSGKLPFVANTDYDLMQQIIHEKPIDFAAIGVSVDSEVSKIITRLLDKKPSKRPESAEALKKELAGLSLKKTERIKPPNLFAKIPAFKIREINFLIKDLNKTWLILGGALLVALALIFLIPERNGVSEEEEPTDIALNETSRKVQETGGGPIFGTQQNIPTDLISEPEKVITPSKKEFNNPAPKKEQKKSEPKKEEVRAVKPKEKIVAPPVEVKTEGNELEEKLEEPEVKKEEKKKPIKINIGGDRVLVALSESISSDKVKIGQKVAFRVSKPLIIKGKTVFEVGAAAHGIISDLRKSSALRKELLEIRINEIKATNGEWISVKAAVFRQVANSSKELVVFPKGQQFVTETTSKTLKYD